MYYRIILLLTLVSVLAGCGDNDQSTTPVVPEFSEPNLIQGRSIWMKTCRSCHLMGVAGAPAIDDEQAWTLRKDRGVNALYHSALNGIRKNGSWAMPPRGGNEVLTDNQVRSAVDFMLAAVDELDDS